VHLRDSPKIHLDNLQVGYKAIAAGHKEQEANNLLEKKIKANSEMTFDQAMEVTICPLRRLIVVFGRDLIPF